MNSDLHMPAAPVRLSPLPASSVADSRLTVSRKALWASRVVQTLAVLFLLMDSLMKVFRAEVAVKGTAELGFPEGSLVPMGLVLLACLILYVVPRTAVLGAILLTGYLGGAIATHVRMGNPLFSHTLFPIYVAAMLWGPLLVRDARARAAFGLGVR